MKQRSLTLYPYHEIRAARPTLSTHALPAADFLQACSAAALPVVSSAAEVMNPFSFILLRDLHYDSLAPHDLKWLDQHHDGDLSQIQNYSRLTA